MEKNWAALTPDERRDVRFKQWLTPDVQFFNPSASRAYRERVTRLINAIRLKTPDRVPCILPAGFFPAYYSGITLRTAIYDYAELGRAWLKFIREFDMDTYSSPATVLPGRVFENLNFRQYKWPGYGLGPDVLSYQYVEGEYMKADEYEALIDDPSDFWMRIYVPRILGALEPLKKLPSFTTIVEIPSSYFLPYAQPDVQAALQALLDAGKETAKWMEAVRECNTEAMKLGFPALRGGVVKAPFDVLADTLRGTRGIALDMYRQPELLLEALERITPLTIKSAVSSVNASGGLSVFMPLHKGDDVFMSNKQFEKFYWPTLKRVVLGLIEEGIVPVLFAEGRYNNRLEIVNDLPRGAVIWQFDQTDMARAKKVLGGNACISGNVPTSLLVTGTARSVKEYCRKLIEECGEGGGFILTGGANLDRGKAENLRAMMEAAKEYGVYK
jgi:uroporphyrinogen-III decarboxylase